MRSSILVLAFPFCVARVAAAEGDAKAKSGAPEQRPAIFAPQPVQKTAPRPLPGRRSALPPAGVPSRRAISPEVAANISAVAMRTAPPAPPPASTAGTSGSDAVKLEAFIVQENKEPALKDREMLTPEGKRALAQKLNPALRAGPLPLGNNALALELLEDQFAHERRGEVAELKTVLSSGGVKPPPEVQRKIDEAMTRKGDWLNQKPGTPFREPR